MGRIGNVGAIDGEAGPETRKAVVSLDGRLALLEGTFAQVVKNGAIVASHADLQDLAYADSGHTGFASTAALTAHTGSTSNPHSTTLQQAIAAGATATSEPTFNGGLDIGTSGRFDSNVQTGGAGGAAGDYNFLFKPTTTLTPGTDRYLWGVQDSSGTARAMVTSRGNLQIYNAVSQDDAVVVIASALDSVHNYGMLFNPVFGNATGAASIAGYVFAIAGVSFAPVDSATATASTLIGGYFAAPRPALRAHSNVIAGLFAPWDGNASNAAHGNIYGIYVKGGTGSHSGTSTLATGIHVENILASATPTTVSQYGIVVDEQTKGSSITNGIMLNLASPSASSTRKLLAMRDQSIYLASFADGDFDINADVEINHWIGANAEWSWTALLSTLRDGHNLAFGTTTGTKLGTATSQKIGFWNATPVVQPAAITQTYSTASTTHSALTSATLTDNSAGTANTTVQALPDPADTPADADTLRDDLVANLIPALRNNFADVTAQVNALIVDVANAKQVLNQVIDDLQTVGLRA